MNYIPIYTINDFNEILDYSFLITGDSECLMEEVYNNTCGIQLSNEALATITTQNVKDFFDTFIKKIAKQLKNDQSATFYCWIDELAAQLRFNVISGCPKKLPFGCTVEKADEIETIINNYLTYDYHAGIPWSEMIVTDNVPDDDDEEDDPLSYILPVFSCCINAQ
jgi:hypothetical protein